MTMFVGRHHELHLLERQLVDYSKAQLIIIYGRRRVGKSTLIRKCLHNEKRVLFFEGIEGAPTSTQIDQFLSDLSRQTGRVKLAAKNWLQVFQGLEETIKEGRWILVFDEFPWMAAGRSQIVADLKFYWDRWSENRKLALFLCGSVASFMIKHIVHSKALHNRKTLEICLAPLTPKESGEFIRKRGLWEKAEMYMCIGGVPKYLEQIDPNISLEKNLNRLCFCAHGFFVNEFETLFKEQFRAVKTYQTLVNLLAKSSSTLSELAQKSHLPKGGGLHQHLQNLILAQFVREYSPYTSFSQKRARTKIYKLIDPFLIFYLRYIYPNKALIEKNRGENLFRAITQSSIDQYFGFAFERLCEASMAAILEKLNLHLADILNMGPFFQRKTTTSRDLQIDNLIMRRDKVWTVMEYKYNTKPLDRGVIDEMSKKLERLSIPSGISIERVLIAAGGVNKAVQQSRHFESILTLKDII